MPRVLFIGNSYVEVNDLPALLRLVARTSEPPTVFETGAVTVGGALLVDHWNAGAAQARIAEGWTHVVLQGQSVEPLLDPGLFVDAAQRLGDLIVDAGATPTFFVTWARAPGHAVYAEPWSGGTPAAMQDGLTQAYEQVSRRWPGAVLARVGEAFRLGAGDPMVPSLLQADGSHPTVAGSYLAACVFFRALTGRTVTSGAEVPAGLSANEAATLRVLAERVP